MPDMMRILVVDDDPVVCDLFQETLEAEGFAVTKANNGPEALRMMRDGGFQLLITDYVMPDFDGLSLLTEAKRRIPSLQVILITAFREREIAEDALRQGASLVLSKPIGQMEIIRIVREVLKSGFHQRRGEP